MLTWLPTILIAMATTLATQLTIGPRLAARTRRILEAYAARDQFSTSVLTVRNACDRLQNIEIPNGASTALTEALRTERQRWVQQIDDATRYMIDNLEWFGLGYVHWTGLRELAVKYVLVVRMIWISERPLRRRLELLDQITEPIQGIFFAYWWHRLRHLRKDIRNFHQQLAELTED